jgi:hypothetical protein
VSSDKPAKGTNPLSEGPPELSIIFAYYDNPQMLSFQVEKLSSLPASVSRRIEVIVVDDASPLAPALSVVPERVPFELRVFRISEDKPWNQDAARNIGAWEARAPLLLLTDIDHVVPASTIEGLLETPISDTVYSLARGAHFSEAKVLPHVNSYVMSRDLYWKVGGYDEDFWGMYGSDWLYRKRLVKKYPVVLREDLTLELVTQGSIPDAKNKVFSRRPTVLRRLWGRSLRALKFVRLIPSPRVLVNPYTRVYPPAAPA